MAKKKFLNLDNMNILWDNIDRNFLRREDIPYTEFEELETDSNTIIGAINELYRLISGGVNPVYPSISCGTSSITENYQSITKTVTATYKDFVKINDPQVTGGSWLTVTQSGSDDSRTYSIKLAENNGATRTGSIVLSCTGINGNAQHTISVKQNGIGDATITVESSFPTTLSDHKAFSRSACYVTYSNWTSINQPTSNASWLTIKEVTGNVDRCNYQISVTENTGSQRSAKLTFSCVGKNGKTISKTHTITQPEAGAASISFNPNPVNVAWDAENATVQVTYSNHSSVLTPTEALAWVDAIEEVTHSGNTYTYRVSGITKNPSNTSRTGKLKFGCNNLLGSPVYSEVSLVQAKAPAGTLTVTPTSKTISADGGTITFTVSFSNSEYYWVEKDTSATWLTIPTTSDSTSGGSTSPSYTVTVAANTNTTSRSTHLVFKCHGHDSQDQSVKVTITQSGKVVVTDNITVSPTSWASISENGGTRSISITSNTNWTISNKPSWITTSTTSGNGNGTVTLTASSNTGSARNGSIVFTAGTASATVTVSQKAYVPDTPEPEVLPMYYGYIPYDSSIASSTWVSEGFNLIAEDWIINGVTNGNITKADAGAMGKTSWGITPKQSFVVIAVPSSSGLVATQDDGFGGKIQFNVNPNSNGSVKLLINGVQYDLYGQRDSLGFYNNAFFYIDKN